MSDLFSTASPASPAPTGGDAQGTSGASPAPAQQPVQTRQPEPPDPGIAHRQQSPAQAQARPPVAGEQTVEAERAELRELRAFKAREDVRRSNVPKSAGDYRAELPADWKTPQGIEFRLDPPDSPLMTSFREFAFKEGWSQNTFSRALAQYGAIKVAEQQQFQTWAREQVNLLGANGQARVDAVATWWNAMTGDKGKVLGNMLKVAPVAATVEALESLIMKFTTQGAGSLSQGHREAPPQANTISDAQWNAMSPGERIEYARGFDQSQFTNGGRR
jgi:hypothetical protein